MTVEKNVHERFYSLGSQSGLRSYNFVSHLRAWYRFAYFLPADSSYLPPRAVVAMALVTQAFIRNLLLVVVQISAEEMQLFLVCAKACLLSFSYRPIDLWAALLRAQVQLWT